MKGVAGKSGSERYVFVKSESGTAFNRLVRYTVEQGLAGLEMHLGLPGSVGGAVAMNSKWMHPSGFVGDAVYQATILTREGEIRVVPQSYFHFSYGRSIIRESGDILIEVVFKLAESDKDKLWQIANDSIAYRRQTQPQGQFCAGCIFRNISRTEALEHNIPNQTTSAGFLIDHSGIKGATVNGARISDTHANFIVNSGNASAADVIKLISRAREQVKKQFRVNLEEEVIRVGDF
jgi:UDP-N-acetylmuramate dehydrogenase